MANLISNWINQILSKITESIRDSGDDINEVIEELELLDDFDTDSVNSMMHNLKSSLENITTLKGKAVIARDDIVQQIIPNGWDYWKESDPDDVLKVTSNPKGNDSIRYESLELSIFESEGVRVISSDIEKLNWSVFEINLDSSSSIYIGAIPAWQLDLCGTVPALEKKLTHFEVSRRVRNPNRKKNHWQRQLNKSNQNSISAFMDKGDSFFANPVIIHMSSNEHIAVTKNQNSDEVKIDVDLGFITNDAFENTSFDVKGQDNRPFTIIDGQHRIRGSANSISNSHRNILVVILPSELDGNTAGRLFAEINTLSRPLNDKHRMFLAHRFSVSSPDPKFNFGPWTVDDLTSHRARANRMSYELASYLMLSANPLVDSKIKLLEQNVQQQQIIDIEKWVEFSYDWFLNNPYNVSSPHTHEWEELVEEVDHYFEAWYDILGEAWENNKVDNCLFKSKTQFRVLLTRFPQIFQKARNLQPEGIISEDIFKQVIDPLVNVPFAHQKILEQFSSTLPDQAWKLLDAWVADAIEAGNKHSRDEILDESIKGTPGAGILSLPIESENWHVEIVGDEGLDPSDGDTRYLTVQRPTNCGYTCKPEIIHKGNKINCKVTVKSKKVLIEENIPIRNRNPLPELDDDVILRITWSTIAGDVTKDVQIR